MLEIAVQVTNHESAGTKYDFDVPTVLIVERSVLRVAGFPRQRAGFNGLLKKGNIYV